MDPKLRRSLAGLCLLASAGQALCAEGRPMVFQHLGLEQGLSQSTVNAIFQDRAGFLWLATQSGLNRYDGTGIDTWFADPSTPGALPGDFIWDIAEDADGDLWLATQGAGLVHWDRGRNRFRRIETPGIDTRLARSLAIVGNSVWLGTRGAGLHRFDTDGLLQASFRHDPADPSSLGADTVSAIAAQGQTLWLATEAGVNVLDSASGTIRRLALPQPLEASALLVDESALWIGSYGQGLLRHDRASGELRHFRHDADDPRSLSHDGIRDLLRDAEGRLWIATEAGLNLYRPQSGDFASYHYDPADRLSLSDDLTMSLLQSRDGVLWIGTRQGGANRWDPLSWDLGSQAPDVLAGLPVLALGDADDGQLWVGAIGAPLIRVDTRGRETARFDPAHGYPARSGAPVSALLRARDGRLWIGTMNQGLEIFDPAAGTLTRLRHDPDDAASLGADGIMCLFQGLDGQIWAGSFGGGLAQIDPASLAVTRHAGTAGDPAALAGARVTAIAEDAAGGVWAATDGDGLNRLDRGAGMFRRFRAEPEDTAGLAADTIYALLHDAQGRLWIGTAGGGLNWLAPGPDGPRPPFRNMTTRDGLSSNVINGIQQDADGQLWMSSNRGLMRLDPDTLKLRYFHRAQGLQSEEFNFGAQHRTPDGRIVFGGTGGYNALDPAALAQPRPGPPVVLTGIEKFSIPLQLDTPLGALEQLTLAHDDDVISFEYAALDYTAPDKNLYSVMLEGFDRDWTPPSYRHRSTYTNLDPGEYVFRVRAANGDGSWNPHSRDLRLTVKAPPWATPQAYAAYALLLFGGSWGFFRWRLRVLEREARIRQLAYYDRVTGLPNRELFEQRCRAALTQARAEDGQLLVICLRFGPLKRLHESLSQMSVDELVGTLGHRLSQRLFGGGDSAGRRDLARLSEHEFVCFVRTEDQQIDGAHWGRQLAEVLAAPLGMDEHRFKLSVSAGIAAYPAHADTVHALIRFAETAAADSESPSGAPFRFYDQAMMRQALDRLALESHLRQAIAEDALHVHLQGKFTRDGALTGAEALCRWQHPERGAVSPGVFVPLAEESDLILELDDWVIGQVCATLHRWRQAGRQGISIAVNISADTFIRGRIFESIERHAARWPIDPTQLEFEITESVLASDLEQITGSLERLSTLGHRLALDDFGTGYSSLTYLQRFPIHTLKIDQAFVRDLENQPEQQALCTSIIALARSMQLGTVAEGVENQAQLDLLRELGCDQMQGFFLQRPQPLADFERALDGGSA